MSTTPRVGDQVWQAIEGKRYAGTIIFGTVTAIEEEKDEDGEWLHDYRYVVKWDDDCGGHTTHEDETRIHVIVRIVEGQP